jgi:cytoskeletal protein RodZ
VAGFGEKLRQAREAHKLTLQDIAVTTKISPRHLQALEEERFSVLPGGVFNKGFVRAYARCVGLDEEKSVAEYMAAAHPAPVEVNMDTVASQIATASPRRRAAAFGPVTIVGVVAVLVGLVLGGLWLREQRRESSEQREQSAQIIAQSQPAAAPVAAAAPATESSSAAQPTTPPTATSPTDAAANQPGAALASTPQHPASVAEAQANSPAEGPAPVEISIAATERAWISVRSDGKQVETITLDPDSPELRLRTYKAQERLLLVVGNPAGLNVTYNGKPAGVLGEEGRRATITFTPEGIEKR